MNYYKILGVENSASSDEIKKAYRKLSLQYHPDKRGGDQNKFKQINEAYSTLKDPEARELYDMKINPAVMEKDAFFSKLFKGMNVSGVRMSGKMGPNVKVYHNGVNVNVKEAEPEYIPEIEEEIVITLDQAYEGCSIPIEITRLVFKTDVIRSEEKETIYVEVKAGIDSNEIITVEGKGHKTQDNQQGDIKVRVIVRPDNLFTRKGLDLLLEKEITLADALCGFVFKFVHLNGKKFTINNKESNVIKPGFTKKIQGLGMIRDGKEGSMYIKFNIKFPEKISNMNKEILRKILG